MTDSTGFDARGNYLPQRKLVEIIEEHKAEIARLRAALEEIRDPIIDQYPTAHDLTEVARKALANEERK